MGPVAREKSHHEQVEVAEAVLGHRQHLLVSPALLWPSVLGETDLLELEEMDQRSCMGCQHHLVKGDSRFCPVFN